jgi:hypothetical protein
MRRSLSGISLPLSNKKKQLICAEMADKKPGSSCKMPRPRKRKHLMAAMPI